MHTLKSVDYFSIHPKHGFLCVEFSDLIKQDIQIKQKIGNITESNLESGLKKQLRKKFHKEIHQELVTKYKDSMHILQNINKTLTNIPIKFYDTAKYVIVVAPIDDLEDSEKLDVYRFLDILKEKISCSLPPYMHNGIKVITLTKFCA